MTPLRAPAERRYDSSANFWRKTPMCNAWNHPSDCDCGFGGETGGGGWNYVRSSWQFRDDDYCRPTSCPECGAPVYFVRHNGGSVWFDELGPPWDKHGCFDDDSTGRTLRGRLKSESGEAGPPVFGIVIETSATPGSEWGQVIVRCSDGTMIDRVMPFAKLAVGQLVLVRRDEGKIVLIPIEEPLKPDPSGSSSAPR